MSSDKTKFLRQLLYEEKRFVSPERGFKGAAPVSARLCETPQGATMLAFTTLSFLRVNPYWPKDFPPEVRLFKVSRASHVKEPVGTKHF